MQGFKRNFDWSKWSCLSNPISPVEIRSQTKSVIDLLLHKCNMVTGAHCERRKYLFVNLINVDQERKASPLQSTDYYTVSPIHLWLQWILLTRVNLCKVITKLSIILLDVVPCKLRKHCIRHKYRRKWFFCRLNQKLFSSFVIFFHSLIRKVCMHIFS